MLTHGVISACPIVKHPNIKIQYLGKKNILCYSNIMQIEWTTLIY